MRTLLTPYNGLSQPIGERTPSRTNRRVFSRTKDNHRASLPSLPEQPTRVRQLVVLVTFLAAFLLYLHRFCMSYAQRYIKEDLQLTDDQIGYCFSAFFLSYALAQVPSGWLSDRFGARRTLTMYILAWSAFTALMGLTMGFLMLLVCRLAAGLGQAGAYPTSAGLSSKWVPFSSRGRASSCVAFGGRLGGGLAPVLTATLIVALVPLSVSARLEPDDLLDVHYLCFKLSSESDESRPSATHKKTAEAAAKISCLVSHL